MASENTVDDEGWTTVVKKQRKIGQRHFVKTSAQEQKPTADEPTIVEITSHESKPPKYVCKWSGIVTKKDTTLTPKERELIKQEMLANPELNICCACCESYMISDLIRRTFFSCGRCYCCVGDNPAFDDDEWVENCTVTIGNFYKYNNDYHYTKNKDFY